MTNKKNILVFVAFLSMVVFIIYTLCYLTPLARDDWSYFFIFGTDTRITSLADVFTSQYAHYLEFNGRAVCHVILQAVEAFLGKGAFNVLNTLMFVVFLYAIAINVSKERKHYYKIFTASFFLLFLLFPGFDLGVLWLSGSFNYLWPATALLFFHYILMNKQYSSRAYILLFLFGFLCGWTNEAFVLGLAGAYFIYYMVKRKELTTQRIIMLAGFFIGALLLVFAPGSISKAKDSSSYHDIFVVFNCLLAMNNLRILPLLVIVVGIMAVRRRIRVKQWMSQEAVLLMAMAISFTFVIYTTYSSEHSRWGIELFSMLLVLRLLPWERMSDVLFHVANVVVAIVAFLAFQANYKCYKVNEEEFAQMSRQEFPVQTEIAEFSPAFDRFIVGYEYAEWGDHSKHYGRDIGLTKYFGYDSVYMLPRSFVQAIKTNPERFNTFQTEETWPFYALKETDKNRLMNYALMELKYYDYNNFSWPFKYFAPYITEYVNDNVTMDLERFKTDSTCYILVRKRPFFADRLKRITLKESI